MFISVEGDRFKDFNYDKACDIGHLKEIDALLLHSALYLNSYNFVNRTASYGSQTTVYYVPSICHWI